MDALWAVLMPAGYIWKWNVISSLCSSRSKNLAHRFRAVRLWSQDSTLELSVTKNDQLPFPIRTLGDSEKHKAEQLTDGY